MANAAKGFKSSMVRINERGEVIVSVAVPVQRFRAVRGALMLQTQGADIDDVLAAERLAIFKVFLVAAGRHDRAVLPACRHDRGSGAPPRRKRPAGPHAAFAHAWRFPTSVGRRDEIGHLSGSIRDMTSALYSRIEAIESFAADVAHELKNPLTSLRSAVETLPLAKTDESRARLAGRHPARREAARPPHYRYFRRQAASMPRCSARMPQRVESHDAADSPSSASPTNVMTTT